MQHHPEMSCIKRSESESDNQLDDTHDVLNEAGTIPNTNTIRNIYHTNNTITITEILYYYCYTSAIVALLPCGWQ